MTMNMPPPYNQPPSYLQPGSQGFSSIPYSPGLNPRYETFRPSQQNIPSINVNRSLSPNVSQQFIPSRSYSPLNVPSQVNNVQGMRGIPSNGMRQNVGGQYLNPQIDQNLYQQMNRSNNFIQQSPANYPHYVPYTQPIYPQYSYQPTYQPANYSPYQASMPHPTYYPHQPVPQTYAPLYSSPQNFQPLASTIYNQMRNNIPEQSLNSNFSYENANFDCNYSVEENLVHCVLCNQTYKISQKKQHLELHRDKVRNVNIRPVDEQQLKRLEKYNSMTRKGLMVKPIVEPDEFNVQYNPNEFVLRKVTQYKDLDAPRTHQIQIQTDSNPIKWDRPQDLGFSESRRSQASSPDRNTRSNRQVENPISAPTNFNRNTNTRFNTDSIREEEQIFLSDKFDHHEGQAFKSNYNPDNSLRESDRRSQASQNLGYENSSSLRPREAMSINRPEDLGYNEESRLHPIREEHEEQKKSIINEIPISQIVNQVQRESQY